MKVAVPVVLALSVALAQSCLTLTSGADMAAEYFTLAESYAEVKKFDKAILFYEKAASSKEFENASLYGLARCRALTGKWPEAAETLMILRDRDPENKLVASSLAYALVSASRVDEGLAMYETLRDKYPDDPVMARNYAELLFVAEKYAETTEQIALIKDRFPDTDGSRGIEALEKKVADATAPKAADAGEKADAGDSADSGASAEAAAGNESPAVSEANPKI